MSFLKGISNQIYTKVIKYLIAAPLFVCFLSTNVYAQSIAPPSYINAVVSYKSEYAMQIKVTWPKSASPNATRYIPVRLAPDEFWWSESEQLYVGYENIYPGMSVSYSVKACTANLQTCSASTATTPTFTFYPDPPTNVQANATQGNTKIYWDQNSAYQNNFYDIKRNGIIINRVQTYWMTYDYTVQPAQNYQYAIRRCAGNVCSDWVNANSVTTPPDTVSASSQDNGNSVTLTWPSRSSPNITHFIITQGSNSWQVNGGNTSFTDTSATVPDGAYKYYFQACINSACSKQSSTGIRRPPFAPMSVGVLSGTSAINIGWSASKTTEVTTYQIVRSDGKTITQAATAPYTYLDTSVVNGTSYTYTVKACSKGWWGNVCSTGKTSLSVTATAATSSSSSPASSSASSTSSATINTAFYAIELVSPETGGIDNYSLGQSVPLAARVVNMDAGQWKDATNAVPKVSFYIDNYAKIGESTGDATAFNWTPPAQGTYAITAKVDLGSGTIMTSKVGAITVSPPEGYPLVKMSYVNKNGGVYPLGGTYSLAVNATDDNLITKAEYYGNNVLLGTVYLSIQSGTLPFNNWKPTVAGSYQVYAKVYDNSGNIATTKSVELLVPSSSSSSSSVSSSASISLTNPVGPDPRIFNLGETLWFASQLKLGNSQYKNPDLSIPTASYYANGTKVGEGPASGWGVSWLPSISGVVNLQSFATPAGQSEVASPVGVMLVTQSGAPRVSLTSPAVNGASYSVGPAIPITVNAVDSDGGSILGVSFYVDGVLVNTDMVAPYAFNFAPSTAKTYKIKAVATDNSGLTTTSTEREIGYGVSAVSSSSSSVASSAASSAVSSTSSSASSTVASSSTTSSSVSSAVATSSVSSSVVSSSSVSSAVASSVVSSSSVSSAVASSVVSSSSVSSAVASSVASSSSVSSAASSSSSSVANVHRMVALAAYTGAGECYIEGNNLTCTGGAEINAPTALDGLENPQSVSLANNYACVLHKPGGQNALLCWGSGKPVHSIDLVDPVSVGVTNQFVCAQSAQAILPGSYCWDMDMADMTVGGTLEAQFQGTALMTDRFCWVTGGVLGCLSEVLPPAPENGIEGEALPIEFAPIGLSVGGNDSYPYVCAISNKQLWCKGDPSGISFSTQLYYPLPAESAYSFKQVSVGESHVCTLQQATSGQTKVECWDSSGELKSDTPATLVNPTQVSAGINKTCVIDDAQKKCW